MMSAIDVTAKTFFEHLYLVLGLGTFGSWVNCPCASTTPTVQSTTISRFPCIFFPRMAPHFFDHHDSPSNLAKSRYPLCLPQRVPELPIRDCARGCNNCVHTRPQMSAIDVTKKDTIWAFVFGSRIGHIWALSQLSLCPTTPTVYSTTISRLPCNFFPRMAPHFFGHHDSPSNLAESRYPPPTPHRDPHRITSLTTHPTLTTQPGARVARSYFNQVEVDNGHNHWGGTPPASIGSRSRHLHCCAA